MRRQGLTCIRQFRVYYPIRFMSLLYGKVPHYAPLFVSLVFHKKNDVVQNDFDLWLVSKERGNRA